MGSTASSSVGFPSSGHDRRAWRGVGSRVAGIAAIALCGFVAFLAFGTAALDTGVYGLPALVLAAAALVLAIVLVRRGRGGASLLVAVVAAPAVIATILAGGALGERNACSGRERHALEQITHVGGVQPGIAGDLQTGGCIVRYNTTVDPTAILLHYKPSLSGNGWLLTAIRPNGREQTAGDLFAKRSAFSIWVSWLPATDSSTRVIVSLHD